MSHLGERISDLIDGRLAPAATEHAHAHLAGCRGCREMVEAERLTKARLSALESPLPGPDLVGRLLAVGGTSLDVVRGVDHRAVDVGPAGSRRPGGAGGVLRPSTRRPGPSTRRPGRWARRPGRTRLAAAMAGSFGVLGAGVFVLGLASPTANAAFTPSANLVAARHVVTMSGLPILNLLPGWRIAQNAPGR